MIALLLSLFLAQDPDTERQVKLLESDDIAVREKATAGLAALQIDKLPMLEKHLNAADPEVGVCVRQAAGRIVGRAFGTRVARMELRPLANRDVVKRWINAGADPKNAPEGTLAVQNTKDPLSEAERGLGLDGDWILVEASVASNEDVRGAEAAKNVAFDAWEVHVKLADAAAVKFDKVAAQLFDRSPKGRMAILLDGRVVLKPMMNSPAFQGEIVIAGFISEADAKNTAKTLTSYWFEVAFSVGAEGPGLDAIEKALMKAMNLKPENVERNGNAVVVRTPVQVSDAVLLDAWRAVRSAGGTMKPLPREK